MNMRKLLYIIVFPLICSVLSCSNHYYDIDDEVDLRNYQNNVSGTYILKDTISNGNNFKLYLNNDNTFIERNHYFTLIGRWYIARNSSLLLKILNVKMIILDMDTIITELYLHYDGTEEYLCWKEAMYYYKKNDSAYMEFCDRFGDRINIYHVCVRDSDSNPILEFDYRLARHNKDLAISAIDLPKETKSISTFVGNAHGVCENYCLDSGSICFIHLQHKNDQCRLLLVGDRLLYMPYDGNNICNARVLVRGRRQAIPHTTSP